MYSFNLQAEQVCDPKKRHMERVLRRTGEFVLEMVIALAACRQASHVLAKISESSFDIAK